MKDKSDISYVELMKWKFVDPRLRSPLQRVEVVFNQNSPSFSILQNELVKWTFYPILIIVYKKHFYIVHC